MKFFWVGLVFFLMTIASAVVFIPDWKMIHVDLFCYDVDHLPQGSEFISCKNQGFIDADFELKVRISLDGYHQFVKELDIGNENRIAEYRDEKGSIEYHVYEFLTGSNDDGMYYATERYDDVRTGVYWKDGILTYEYWTT